MANNLSPRSPPAGSRGTTARIGTSPRLYSPNSADNQLPPIRVTSDSSVLPTSHRPVSHLLRAPRKGGLVLARRRPEIRGPAVSGAASQVLSLNLHTPTPPQLAEPRLNETLLWRTPAREHGQPSTAPEGLLSQQLLVSRLSPDRNGRPAQPITSVRPRPAHASFPSMEHHSMECSQGGHLQGGARLVCESASALCSGQPLTRSPPVPSSLLCPQRTRSQTGRAPLLLAGAALPPIGTPAAASTATSAAAASATTASATSDFKLGGGLPGPDPQAPSPPLRPNMATPSSDLIWQLASPQSQSLSAREHRKLLSASSAAAAQAAPQPSTPQPSAFSPAASPPDPLHQRPAAVGRGVEAQQPPYRSAQPTSPDVSRDLGAMASLFWGGIHNALSPQSLDVQWYAIKQAVASC